jgi:nitrate reductase gamma subunit
METMLEFAKGPLFICCFTVMILGLLRTEIMNILAMRKALQRAGDKNVPYKKLWKETLQWIFPFKNLFLTKPFMSLMSFLFHVCIIIVPVLLIDHILLWKHIGISWPGIPGPVADVLTVIAIMTGMILFLNRIIHREARFLSSVFDYLLLLLIVTIFFTGFIASRGFNPLTHTTTMVLHIMLGNTILVLFPFTKLSHSILFPLLRFASNIAWRFPPNAGEAINKTLYGKEIKEI